MEDYAIEVKNVSLEFCLYSENVSSIKEYFIKKVKREISKDSFWALKDISFNVKKGEAVGLVGKNGCGKSTMLKTIAGVLTPTMGTVKVNGTVAPMIELGAGFDPELTARENIFLNGAILGYPQEMLKERFDEIIDFAELKDFVEGISVYARVSPEHKIRIVRAWQEKGMIVAMTGDGVNDAPALKQADIGVAMGITGTEVAKDAAAMVLTDDNFATIVKAVENGRNLYQNIKYAIRFLLSGNFGAILAVLCASIAGLPVPFAPVHLLFINLLTDSLPAIALGVEPHSSEVMNEKPRSADESILTKDFLGKIGLEGFVIGTMTMLSFLTGYHMNGALLGSTFAFGTLCLARLFHGFNCKSDHPVIFTKRFFNNKWLQGAFVLGAVLITTVLTVPGLHRVFKVETLNLMQLGCVYLYAFASLLIIQLLKWIRMKFR